LKYIIIRDDDISYFTPPNILEDIYGEILDDNKISFSVIPNIYASIDLNKTGGYYKNKKLDYDPLIDPEYRGKKEYYNVENNYKLIEFLNKKNINVLQHGYAHERINNIPEFSINNRDIIYERAIKGKNILKKIIKKDIDIFIPPWNSVSKEAFKALNDEYKGIVAATMYPLTQNIDLLLPYYIKEFFNNNYYLYKNLLIINNYVLIDQELGITLLKDKMDNILKRFKVMVIQNHYWDFFEDWNKWGKINKLIDNWKFICEYIKNNDDIKVVSYQDLINSLKNKNNDEIS
jgi:predicted deacetylase